MEDVTNTKRHRSPAYPSINLERAIPLVKQLYEKFSDDSFSRESAVIEAGLGTGGGSFRKIAALVQFGLLDRKGSSYKITALAKNIIYPGDDDKLKSESIISAAKTPKLYKVLVQSYQGKQFPTALHHRLIRDEKYNQTVAEKVTRDFKKSIEYAGILRNGIIVDSPQAVPSEEHIDDQERLEFNNQEIEKPHSKSITPTGITIPLGESNITVIFPANLVREVASGKFKDILDTLESLGKEEKV